MTLAAPAFATSSTVPSGEIEMLRAPSPALYGDEGRVVSAPDPSTENPLMLSPVAFATYTCPVVG